MPAADRITGYTAGTGWGDLKLTPHGLFLDHLTSLL